MAASDELEDDYHPGIVVIAGVAYFKFFEMKRPSTEEARRQVQNMVNFDRSKIDGIIIQNGDQRIEIRRRENKWRLETPIKDQADSALIETLLSDLENWQKEGTIPSKEIDADKGKLAEYGLNNPKLRLKLLGHERPPEILFGKDAAMEGGRSWPSNLSLSFGLLRPYSASLPLSASISLEGIVPSFCQFSKSDNKVSISALSAWSLIGVSSRHLFSRRRISIL